MYIKEKKLCPVYISKISLNCEKQIISLRIPNEEKEGWNYQNNTSEYERIIYQNLINI